MIISQRMILRISAMIIPELPAEFGQGRAKAGQGRAGQGRADF